MRPRKNINKLLDRLSESEERFLTRKFLAPAVRGRKVGVAIDGVRLDLETHPKNFEGWGVFRPESHNTSRFVRDATLLEQRRYLDMLPMVRMILCTPEKNFWRAVPADSGTKLTIVGAPPIRFVENAERFQTVRTRFDGSSFWFDGVERNSDPTLARSLSSELEANTPPEHVRYRGLTAQHRLAYEIEHARRAVKQFEKAQLDAEGTLREALEHAGGKLDGFARRGDGYRVSWRTPDGRQHTSSVNSSDLTVQVAGICLDGHDQQFDLASLVSVYEEAARDERWLFH